MMKNYRLILMTLSLLLVLSLSVSASNLAVNDLKLNFQKLDAASGKITSESYKVNKLDLVQAPMESPATEANYLMLQGGEDIGTAVPITSLPVTLTGTTATYANDYDELCPNASSSPDVVYSFTPASNMRVHLLTCNSSYWTKLFIYQTDETNLLACNQYSDSCLPDFRAALWNIDLLADTTYYFVVDGYGGQSGDYELEIQALPPVDVTRIHPALGDAGNGTLLYSFEYNEYDSTLYWMGSADDGANMSGAISWNLSGKSGTYPSTDFWGDNTRFFATLVSPPTLGNGGDPFYMEAPNGADPDSYTGGSFGFSGNGWSGMVMSDIACSDAYEYFQWGVISFVFSNVSAGYDSIPVAIHPDSMDGTGSLWVSLGGWLNNGCVTLESNGKHELRPVHPSP